jgi:hypothetical protein
MHLQKQKNPKILIQIKIKRKNQHKIQINSNKINQVCIEFYCFSLLYFIFLVEKQTVTNTVYVGQLPENVEESDLKKLFPKSTKIELIPTKTTPKGVRPGFAFVTFSDDNSAAAAIKLGPSLKLKNTQLKVGYQTKRQTTA